jgi:hypothetical protein
MSAPQDMVTLREYFDLRVKEMDRRIEQKFSEHDKAIVLARDSSRANVSLLLSLLALMCAVIPLMSKK